MKLAEIIGENLRVLMAVKQVTVSEVHQETNISRSTLATIKSGEFKMIQTRILETLANYFEVTVAQLVTPFKEE